jgi:hypothetical protein
MQQEQAMRDCAFLRRCSHLQLQIVRAQFDLPRIESDTTPPCQRHLSNPADKHPGHGCVVRLSSAPWLFARWVERFRDTLCVRAQTRGSTPSVRTREA